MDRERIERLRRGALCAEYDLTEIKYRFFKAHGVKAATAESYAPAYEAMMETVGVYVDPDELIVGRYGCSMTESERSEWKNSYEAEVDALYTETSIGQNSHMAVDYPLLLSEGLEGVIARIGEYEKTAEADKLPFYASCKAALRAVIRLSDRYAERVEEMAKNESGQRRIDLLGVARNCRNVPRRPASSFYEALQSVHFLSYALSLDPLRKWHQQFQLGHPDRYLYPYYERDIMSGAITRERAQLLLDLLGIQINMRVPSGLSSGYMVGGRYPDGAAVANELTAMLMQVVDDIRLVYPAVGLCYTSDTPEELLDLACRILSKGRSHPAIFNDDVITKGICSYGVPIGQAREYIHSTCVEITPVASSNVWVASPYTNMAQLLLDVMDTEYADFDGLLAAIFKRIDTLIGKNHLTELEKRETRAKTSVLPLLSCFVNDCLARGVDIEKGGARYNWVLPSFVGMANLVDSLYALKRVVYEEKRLTLAFFKAILDKNFEGSEELRSYVMSAVPKYGNDIDEVDGYFGMMTEHIVAECRKYNGVYSGSQLIPSVFCWVMHERFGRNTGATPDGRLAGFPLGDGSGPCQGRELKGPTASILSSTKWEHSPLIGGVAVNMKFSKSNLGEHSVEVMKSLVRTYIERGGFEMQINVTDREILEAARENPELYSDLVVRIGGYSDYFTRLSPEMQAEVILRTEHSI
jgi:formate C-acetyltransferase